MTRTWLFFDVSSVAYRHFFGSGGDPGAAAPGLLADVAAYSDRFATRNFAFCFDRPPGLRQQKYPWYKANRAARARASDDPGALRRLRDELKELRLETLPDLGFTNLFSQPGYEGDDLLAACCAALPPGDSAVVVSADNDLEQLLGPSVSRYPANNGPRLAWPRSDVMFRSEWGLDPPRWSEVKALVGDAVDCVPGVEGVGPCYAVNHLRGLPIPGPRRRAIEAFVESGAFDRNLELVRLPFAGCRPVTLDAKVLV